EPKRKERADRDHGGKGHPHRISGEPAPQRGERGEDELARQRGDDAHHGRSSVVGTGSEGSLTIRASTGASSRTLPPDDEPSQKPNARSATFCHVPTIAPFVTSSSVQPRT